MRNKLEKTDENRALGIDARNENELASNWQRWKKGEITFYAKY